MDSFEILLGKLRDRNPALIEAVEKGYRAYLEMQSTTPPVTEQAPQQGSSSPQQQKQDNATPTNNNKEGEQPKKPEDKNKTDKKQSSEDSKKDAPEFGNTLDSILKSFDSTYGSENDAKENEKSDSIGEKPKAEPTTLTGDFSFLNGRIAPWLGTPYQMGGKGMPNDKGIDCSGFVHQVLPEIRNAPLGQENASMLMHSPKMTDLPTNGLDSKALQKGDIIFLKADPSRNTDADHVAIYMGNGEIAHSRGSKGVVVEPIPPKYNTTFVKARRPNTATAGEPNSGTQVAKANPPANASAPQAA